MSSKGSITLTEARSSTPSPRWWGRAGEGLIIQIGVIIHQVKVDTRFDDALRLLPYRRTLPVSRWRVHSAVVAFLVTGMTPTERPPAALWGTSEKKRKTVTKMKEWCFYTGAQRRKSTFGCRSSTQSACLSFFDLITSLIAWHKKMNWLQNSEIYHFCLWCCVQQQ